MQLVSTSQGMKAKMSVDGGASEVVRCKGEVRRGKGEMR